MGFFNSVLGNKNRPACGAINYGRNKVDGGHDHRTNSGEDRTPAQKAGDKKKRKKP